MNDNVQNKPVDFQIGAEFTFFGLPFTGIADKRDSAYMLTAFTRNVDIGRILSEDFTFPEALKGVAGLDLEIKELLLFLSSDGTACFRGDVTLQGKQTLGSDLKALGEATRLTLKFNIVMTDNRLSSVEIRIYAETETPLLPEITCRRMDLVFTWKNEEWKLGGHITAQLFDRQRLDLFASYEKDAGGDHFQLTINFSRDRGAIQKDDFTKIHGVSRALSVAIWRDLKEKSTFGSMTRPNRIDSAVSSKPMMKNSG